MADKDLSKAIELLHIGFNISIDAKKHQDDIETILETAMMFNSTVVLRNPPESMLTEKNLKKLKSQAHKVVIEL